MTSLCFQDFNDEYHPNYQESTNCQHKKLQTLSISDQTTFYPLNNNLFGQYFKNTYRKVSQDCSHLSCLQKNHTDATICYPTPKIEGMILRVYFYELKQCKEFQISQFDIASSVKEFIEYAIYSFLYESYNFIPEAIDLSSFQIKLLNENKQNKIMNHHEIAQYFCENLLIQKKQIINSNLDRFKILCPQEIVIEIHIAIPKARIIMNLNKDMKFYELKTVIMKKFNFKTADDFIFITYFNMQLIDESLKVSQIQQRRIEFLKIRKIDFQFYIHEKQYKSKLEKQKKKLEQISQLQKNTIFKIQTEIFQCVLIGKMKLSIEGDYIIEKYEQGPLFKIISLFLLNNTEKKYEIKDLIAVYLQENFLVLKFENFTKKYKMSHVQQKQFLHEILRRCRILKKTLNPQ